MKNIKFLFLLILPILGCKKDDDTQNDQDFYFPSNTNSSWETKSLVDLGWNESAVNPLKEYLIQKNTKSFMILVNGRIVMEEYFDGHTKDAIWQWNSAGKTLVSATTGIAQQEGWLDINTPV